jgi:hypothetical protein
MLKPLESTVADISPWSLVVAPTKRNAVYCSNQNLNIELTSITFMIKVFHKSNIVIVIFTGAKGNPIDKLK